MNFKTAMLIPALAILLPLVAPDLQAGVITYQLQNTTFEGGTQITGTFSIDPSNPNNPVGNFTVTASGTLGTPTTAFSNAPGNFVDLQSFSRLIFSQGNLTVRLTYAGTFTGQPLLNDGGQTQLQFIQMMGGLTFPGRSVTGSSSAVALTAAPEPATSVLVLLGIAGVIGGRRYRRYLPSFGRKPTTPPVG